MSGLQSRAIDFLNIQSTLPTPLPTGKRSASDLGESTATSTTNKLKHPKLSDNIIPSEKFLAFKTRLIRQVNQTLPVDETKVFSYLTETRQEISRILKQSIVQKESHSVVMVGPRSSYKTFLVNHELSILAEENGDQFITVRLSGLIHTEQSAINSIATQLESELQRLNPDEALDKDDNMDVSSGSLTEVFEKILRLLDTRKTQSLETRDNMSTISVIFIFDEIDTFAGPVRQTLLYNLFDMVEHALVPVCIIGSTTKLNIAEFFEKRVKSRFSQRILYMPECKDLDAFATAAQEMLTVDQQKNTPENEYITNWNKLVDQYVKDEESHLFREIRKNYETFKSLTILRNSFLPFIAPCQTFPEVENGITSCDDLVAYTLNQFQGTAGAIVQSLSELELAILLAAARTATKNKEETTNFNLTYVEYSDMIKSLNARIPSTVNLNSHTDQIVDNLVKLWDKDDIKNVWETLHDLTLITEKGDVGVRESATAVFYASNYVFQTSSIPFDLRVFNIQVSLLELRRIVPKSSIFYPWTQL